MTLKNRSPGYYIVFRRHLRWITECITKWRRKWWWSPDIFTWKCGSWWRKLILESKNDEITYKKSKTGLGMFRNLLIETNPKVDIFNFSQFNDIIKLSRSFYTLPIHKRKLCSNGFYYLVYSLGRFSFSCSRY